MAGIKPMLLAGLGAAALVGAAGVALANSVHLHTLTVRLPEGGFAKVLYVGDQPPKVAITRQVLPFDPIGPAMFPAEWDAHFAMLDQAAAQLDRQAAMLLQQAGAFGARGLADGQQLAAFGGFPAGAQSYSIVSMTTGHSVCGHSVETVSQGPGKAPRTMTRSWGDCASPIAPSKATTPKPASGGLIEAKAGVAHASHKLPSA